MKKRKLGIGFAEEVAKVTLQNGHFKHHLRSNESWKESLIPNFDDSVENSSFRLWRLTCLISFVVVAFFIIFLRLFHLQIAQGSENRNLADGNRIQIKIIHASRGVIFDRDGDVLAKNEPGFRLLVNSKARYISRDDALKMETSGDPNYKNLEIDNIRSYRNNEKTAHILGYVGEITEEELKLPQFRNYRPGDQIGRGGIEEAFESYLKGSDGGEIVEVDAEGREVRIIRKTDSIPGGNLYLTIDGELQNQAFDKLLEATQKSKSCCASLVASNPATGEILALVSLPSFDPTKIDEALIGKNSPLLNRVIGGTYPPGSTFKIASALAGLQSGKITPGTIYEDTGIVRLGLYEFTNWYFTQHGGKEGSVDMVKALKRSNDTYFYQLGQAIGEKNLAETAGELGLGSKLGIEIAGEEMGLIPGDAWKRQNINEVWFPGDTLHMAIGQGYVLSTPLQINNLISLVATGGEEFQPHLALKLTDSNGKLIKNFEAVGKQLKFKKEYWAVIKHGLSEVPKAGGTAWPFFNFPIATAGKTGTAEFGAEEKTHAWYTSYAPIDDPKIAVTVLIEGGGEGSSVASPVVKELYRYYFSEDKNNLIKDIGQIASDSAKILGE